MTYKEQALEFLGITRFHEAGYTGKGIKILSRETVTQKNFPNVIAPKGYANKSGHGDNVMAHIVLIAPDAEHISLSFGGTYKSDTYENDCVDYILANKVDICTTSLLGGEVNGGKAKAVQDCLDNDCIMICAAGNNGEKGLNAESKSPLYLAIGGVKPTYTYKHYDDNEPMFDFRDIYKTSCSAVGEEIDYVTIAEILGCAGTSFCSPVFASMLALVQQFFVENIGRKLTNTELIEFVDNNLVDTDEEGFDIRTGKGIFVLPEPSSIDLSKYKTSYIDYSGFPQIEGEEMEIKEMLLTPSEWNRPQTKIKPTAIAWHYVGNPNTSALANRNYFENLSKTHATKASSHYIIGLEGEILHLIPDDEISYCTNQANNYTISVECCHPDSSGKFNEKTYNSMVWLGRYLMKKHGINQNIRHYDVTLKHCPKWFVDCPNEWGKFKEKLEGVEEVRYKTVEELPEYAKEPIQELIDKGILSGKGGDLGLDLSEDMVRILILAKRIFEQKGL